MRLIRPFKTDARFRAFSPYSIVAFSVEMRLIRDRKCLIFEMGQIVHDWVVLTGTLRDSYETKIRIEI